MSDSEEGFIDDDQKDDEELMQNLMLKIAILKKEKPPTPAHSETEALSSESEVEPTGHEDTRKASKSEENIAEATEPINLDILTLSELRNLQYQVDQARDYNNQLQGILLLKEVKLLAIKRHLSTAKSEEQNKQKEDQRTDVGRYYVRFKAPYFKDVHNFAGYVIVPESQLPVTAQRYETRAGQWNKPALKDLEAQVKVYLTTRRLREEIRAKKPKNLKEKEKIISTYHYLRKQAPLSALVKEDFDEIIDWCSVASKMKKDYSPNECQKAWNIFLRPDINKKKWTVGEKENLKRVALEHNYEDWDGIAWELGTNRNGYQCFHMYVDKIMKLVEGDWSVAEEDFLTKLVKECTYGDKVMWHKVAYFFETRTMTQIYRKWTLSCVGKEVVAGAFTEEEDKTIMDMLIVNKGRYSINQVAKKLNRISSQIRYRFSQLKCSLKHKYGEWSVEEDKQLLELVEKYGKKSWSKIAEHMPERGRVQIRHRYTNLRKRLASDPKLSLESLIRHKRPVHSKRKETNMKCLMELSGIEETLADGDEEEDRKAAKAVEELLGPVRKKNRRHPEDPMADVSPSRYPDLDEDDENVDLTDIKHIILPGLPQFPNEQDSLKSPKPTRKRATRQARKPRRKSVPKIEPQEESESESEQGPEPDDPLPDPETKQRPTELYGPLMEYYTTVSDLVGNPIKPPSNQGGRKTSKAETLNSILRFTPYKYFDPKNADWTYNADRADPYFSEVFKVIEEKEDSGDDDDSNDDKVPDNRLLPPCLTNFHGFYNLLVDMGLTEEDLDVPNDKLEDQLKNLYCDDEETAAAVDRWNKRLTTLFAWPAALSSVFLEMPKPNRDKMHAEKEVRPSTSRGRGRSRSKPKFNKDAESEPMGDDECCLLTALDLTENAD